MYTPVNPFYYIKWGVRGSSFHRFVFVIPASTSAWVRSHSEPIITVNGQKTLQVVDWETLSPEQYTLIATDSSIRPDMTEKLLTGT